MSRRFVLIIFLMVSAAALQVAAAAPAGDQDLNLSDLFRENSTASPAPPERRPEGIPGAVDTLLGGRALPIPCASSLLADARRHRAQLSDPGAEALRILSQVPALDHDGARPTRDGRFTIHYTQDAGIPDAVSAMDRDFNGVPDVVDQVELALERAQQVLVDQMGWPAPSSGTRSDRYDIYLASLGGARQGITVPDREIPSTPRDDSGSHILLDPHLEGDALSAAVAHQYAHASLLSLSGKAPAWWSEASAAWLETQVTGDPSRIGEPLAKRLEKMDTTLATDSLTLAMGNLLWTSFLADRNEDNGEEIRQIWLEMSLRGNEPALSLMDEVLRRMNRGTLQEAFRDYTRWALFTGPRDDGDHFRMGSLYPPLTPRTTHRAVPADSAGLESVEPLGAAMIRFEGDGSRGGLRIRFDAEAPSPLQVDLVITQSGRSGRHLVEVELDDRGHGDVGIPWKNVREAVLIVRHPGVGGSAARFRYAAQLDPAYPFDLASFSAIPSPAGITLQWETSREIDVLGWNVYRSANPSDSFQKINPVALLSGADSLEETDYLYQDTSVQPGHRYYYLVEAITILGLPERSLVLSVRVPDDKTRR